MRVNITPQWKNITDWYWDDFDRFNSVDNQYLSIWDVLKRDYGAEKRYSNWPPRFAHDAQQMWAEFPDEKSYTAFLLRWS